MNEQHLRLPRAILFDMDGTLTKPMLDFAAIKSEMGIGNRPILEAMSDMSDAQRVTAQQVLDRHEERAAVESVLNAGCLELIAWVESRGIRTAIITRNSRRSVDVVLARHGLEFELLITREDGKPKPDPAPLLWACQKLCVPTAHTWMVGDGQYDIEAGNAASIKTVWVSHSQTRPFAAVPWRTVTDLHELATLLKTCQNCSS